MERRRPTQNCLEHRNAAATHRPDSRATFRCAESVAAMYRANEEPRIEELMSDPIVSLLLERDSLQPEQVWRYIRCAQRSLRQRLEPKRESAAGDHVNSPRTVIRSRR